MVMPHAACRGLVTPNFPADTVIQKCFERAKEAGNEYFGVQYNVECYTSKDAGSTYNKYGKGSGCKFGREGGWLMTVYRINQKGTYSKCVAWQSLLHTKRFKKSSNEENYFKKLLEETLLFFWIKRPFIQK